MSHAGPGINYTYINIGLNILFEHVIIIINNIIYWITDDIFANLLCRRRRLKAEIFPRR